MNLGETSIIKESPPEALWLEAGAARPHDVRMSIQLAPSALERVQSYLAAEPAKAGLRFGVRKTGCSGWGYVIEMADAVNDADAVFEQAGVKILVDPASLPLVDGTEIDFIKQGLNEQFVFRNPQVKGECGCGESFTTDPDKVL